MPLRDLLNHAQKCSRDLMQHAERNLLPCLDELKERSSTGKPAGPASAKYPASLRRSVSDYAGRGGAARCRRGTTRLIHLWNALQALQQTAEETQVLTDYLSQRLREVREHARREIRARSVIA
jgi:hypothetical protein